LLTKDTGGSLTGDPESTSLPDRPAFRVDLYVEVVRGESLFALSEDRSWRFHSQPLALVAELIDGQRTVSELVEALKNRYTPIVVESALQVFQKHGLLVESEVTDDRCIAGYWHSLGSSEAAARRALAASPVAIRCVGDVKPEPVRVVLTGSGVRVEERTATFTLVLVDDYLRNELEVFNQDALRSKARWMLLKTRGKLPSVGPLFEPDTACWLCLAARLRSNRQVEAYLRQRNSAGSPIVLSRPASHHAASAAASLAVGAIVRWLVNGHNPLRGKLVRLHPEILETQHHVVVKRPQCPACGDPSLQRKLQERPVSLESSPKVFTEDGGHRACSPGETVQRLAHHVSPITGLIAGVNGVGAAGAIAPSFISGHNLSRVSKTSFLLEHHLAAVSRGAGKTEEQARASAICEALERACGVYRGDEAKLRARLSELAGDAIHPNRCLHFSERQYRMRDEWNEKYKNPTRWVPEPFVEDESVDWSPVWSLTHQARRYLPTALCYYDYPFETGPRFARADSNGSAAGNTIAEAVVQGLLEVVERDSVALWWYNELRAPKVALDSFDEDYFTRLEGHYASLERDFWVLDITTDVGIPAFAAVSRQHGAQQRISVGFGAHLDARVGILRALAEMNQFLPFVASEEASKRVGDADIEHWLADATVGQQSYLRPFDDQPAKRRDDYAVVAGLDLRDDAERCVGALSKVGMETLVLNQSRPDVDLCVVKVIVPEMRHFWPRFAPGRLYDVPARMGWLPRARAEHELNAWHVFI
jgi:bacteriocin biosynthesis cyclodehydratase domain-containing protein